MNKIKRILLKVGEYLIVTTIVSVTVLFAANKNRFSDYLTLYDQGRTLVDTFIEYETAGVLNLTTSLTGIGTMRPTGVTKSKVIDFGNDTFADQWVPAAADSDLGIRFNGDVIIDSISVLSTYGSGDTAIVNIYKTTAIATAISTADTLISGSAGYQTIDLTGVAAGTRDIDISAGEALAIQIDEHGALELVSVFIYYREYDAQ